ncbi:segregation and condensation protein A [Coralliovum pocilloporae]|uniref:segregation and condensation protein A n=1 Tax=Coralliovum pocilloporae TaxID=3066369 RepID=UPI003307B43A
MPEQSEFGYQPTADKAASEPSLVVDVDGFEGPLDLLLSLARSQKVDLSKISILELAEQYLGFIAELRQMRIELAADYLVMAAWLAYLKSRLLLPEPEEDDEPSGEELAAILAFKLQRLEAMRDAARRLVNRDRLGRDVHGRGMPEQVIVESRSVFSATLYDLLIAYASQRQRQSVSTVHVRQRKVWSLQDARDILTRLMGGLKDWTPIDRFLVDYLVTPEQRATVLASSFSASLELVREGQLELRQSEPFASLYVKKRTDSEDKQ